MSVGQAMRAAGRALARAEARRLREDIEEKKRELAWLLNLLADAESRSSGDAT